ncbi:MAG: GNAT family N-acetyltransferase [Cytophagales bacterium]|jgi:ribosomal protein S18 acetylase RimI-like enzyme|nr:GNAT family N-acetyltransferase [Cytophagales bacterium]
MAVQIRSGTLNDVIATYPDIPELTNPHGKEEYERRLSAAPKHLILVAFDGPKPVGFKVGYERENDGSFYSWMGGVSVHYRRLGIARQLADQMETWAVAQGYHSLKFTTRNRHRAMLVFALNNGFQIYETEPRDSLEEYRIRLVKNCSNSLTIGADSVKNA